MFYFFSEWTKFLHNIQQRSHYRNMADLSVTWDHSRSPHFLVLVFALEIQWYHVNALQFQGTSSTIFRHIRGSEWLRRQCWSLLEKWNFLGKRGIYNGWSTHSASAENLGGVPKNSQVVSWAICIQSQESEKERPLLWSYDICCIQQYCWRYIH